jgi:hypothetical protein
MSRTCYLHIGLRKTGTTAIQGALFANRELLKTHGIHYLGIEENHSAPIYTAFSDNPEAYYLNVQAGLGHRDAIELRRQEILRVVGEEIDSSKEPIFVISGEDIAFLGPSGAERLRAFLAPRFEHIQIVVYVRHPFGFASSAAQQRIKGGRSLDHLRAKLPVPDYRRQIEPFSFCFGRPNVMVREYDLPKLGNDVVQDFVKVIAKTNLTLPSFGPDHSNRSLSRAAVAVLDAVNRKCGGPRKDMNKTPRAKRLHVFAGSLKGEPFRFDPHRLKSYAEVVKNDVEWLATFTKGNIRFALDVPEQESTTPEVPEYIHVDDVAQMLNSLALEYENEKATRAIKDAIAKGKQTRAATEHAICNWLRLVTHKRNLLDLAKLLAKAEFFTPALACARKAVEIAPDDPKAEELLNKLTAVTAASPHSTPASETMLEEGVG